MNKSIISMSLLAITLTGCGLMSQKDFVQPSDVLVDKTSLIGTTGNVGGYLHCNDDYCTINETKSKYGIAEGSSVVVKIDNLSKEDKKFLITKCVVGESCSLVVTGEYVKDGLSGIGLQASAIEKVGLTKLLNSF